MATNIELERQINALKAEVADLKSALSSIFSNRMFEQPDIRLAWEKLTAKATETATPEAPIPAAPTPAADWLEKVNAAIKDHGQ